MGYDDELLSEIYDKTNGYCRYCGKKLAWRNYGILGARATWEVDHGIPLSRGGSDYFRNLWSACIECNREKGDMTTREFRRYLEREYGW
jgi:5-methylcytosine-specific restriction endonuclease McrA